MSASRFENRYNGYKRLLAESPIGEFGSDYQKESLLRSMDNAHRLMSSSSAKAFDLALEPPASVAKYVPAGFDPARIDSAKQKHHDGQCECDKRPLPDKLQKRSADCLCERAHFFSPILSGSIRSSSFSISPLWAAAFNFSRLSGALKPTATSPGGCESSTYHASVLPRLP